MLGRLRTKLTYANVTATLALAIAIGGGSAYAINEWNGSNIQDETLTGDDIRGSKAAGTAGTLRGEDVRDETLTNTDLATNTLTGSRIRNDALNGADIKESTLAQVPDAAAINGVRLTGLARIASQHVTLKPNSSTSLTVGNLGIPGFGSILAYCDGNVPNAPSRVWFINGSGVTVEVWADNGSTQLHDTLQSNEDLEANHQPPNDILTFVVGKPDGTTATIVIAYVVKENIFAAEPYHCVFSTQVTFRTP